MKQNDIKKQPQQYQHSLACVTMLHIITLWYLLCVCVRTEIWFFGNQNLAEKYES